MRKEGIPIRKNYVKANGLIGVSCFVVQQKTKMRKQRDPAGEGLESKVDFVFITES